MKKLKQYPVLMLILSFAFVSACSSSNNAASSSSPSASPSASAAPSASPTPAPTPKIDMGGKTLTILTEAPEEIPTDKTDEGAKMLANQKAVEQKYNVKIVWKEMPWGEDYKALTKAGLSGEPVADIVWLDRYFAYPAVMKGLLRPVDDLFDFKDKKWPAGTAEHGSVNGKVYGFKQNSNLGAGIYYNKTLFKREGLPDPHQLEADGKWTWDAFLDIAKKATKDTDGDGQIDQWGFTNEAGIMARLLVSSNGGKIVDYRDGKWVFAGGEPKSIEALNFLNELYNKSKVAAPNKTGNFDNYGESQKIFNSGKAAMVSGELWEGMGREKMTDEQGFVLFPKGPSAKADSDYRNANENFPMYYIPANAKYPKETAQIWQDLILWDRVAKNDRAFFETQKLADAKDVDDMVKSTQYAEPVFIPGDLDFYAAAREDVAIKGEAPESAIEKIKQKAQASVDTTLNGKQ